MAYVGAYFLLDRPRSEVSPPFFEPPSASWERQRYGMSPPSSMIKSGDLKGRDL